MVGGLSAFRTVKTDAVELLYCLDPQGGMVAPFDFLKHDWKSVSRKVSSKSTFNFTLKMLYQRYNTEITYIDKP